MTDMTGIKTDLTVPADVGALMDEIGYKGKVALNCHVVSLAIVQSGIYPGSRVARGGARGVMGQHSWVILGREDGSLSDPYSERSRIVDATLWSYDMGVTGVWRGPNLERHWPHQSGHFLMAGMPHHQGGDTIRLVWNTVPSASARKFLSMIEPLDLRGWHAVAHLPVQGWPAGEIFTAMRDTPGLGVLIPIDTLGMTTTLNPEGLYLETKGQS